ncbi:MAG: hypothetical protein J0I17_05565 ['Candidatus Kapabacteria' thiocyanatum]|uniref:Outer membrane protein beta-barrel domain-containing protein n=1 Tax=Candidatus Kapaibacterium thiocyanatum TaxID=1895771 RepID=A0A1M3L565_9BACT|nr:hypothetical protein ['Candidatus Kapabacteria' thiocyanatum]OJX60690.1 MAG: hypothetical protein BGO89_03705 ['Candidatus Kapabacteria' thiocyanatum]
MNIIKRTTVVFALALAAIAPSIHAQEAVAGGGTGGSLPPRVINEEELMIERLKAEPLNWFAGIRFQVGNPQGAFRDSLASIGAPQVGYGFDLNVGYYFDPVPVAVTLEGGVLFMGMNSRSQRFPSGLFWDTLKFETQTSIIPLNVSARLQPDIATWVFPYVEGIVGMNLFLSNYEITQTRFDVNRRQSENRSDVSFTYGVGVGISAKIADVITLPSQLNRILFDVRMRYLKGGGATLSNFELSSSNSYTFKSAPVSSTDMVMFNVGIAVQF